MNNNYLEKIKSIAVVSDKKVQLYVFCISNNYEQIYKHCDKETTLVFVDAIINAWKDYQQIQINDLAMIGEIIQKLPDNFCQSIVIDSTDRISGDLKAVFAKCAIRNINVNVICGMTQTGKYYNFGKFLESRSDKVFMENGEQLYESRAIYELALRRADGCCEVCGRKTALEMHHILSGRGNRTQQERLETVIMLCEFCHRGEKGVHGKDGNELNLKLKLKLQEYYKQQGHSEDEIRKLMGGKLYA